MQPTATHGGGGGWYRQGEPLWSCHRDYAAMPSRASGRPIPDLPSDVSETRAVVVAAEGRVGGRVRVAAGFGRAARARQSPWHGSAVPIFPCSTHGLGRRSLFYLATAKWGEGGYM